MIKLRFVPDFDISEKNLDTSYYQVRQTKRTSTDIAKLKTVISLQGQVEPIQVLFKDNKYYLISGEGRVIVLRQLNLKAKAIVYEGLTKEDILKIATGSNEARLEMSEWDKISSVGIYYDEHKYIEKDSKYNKSLSSIFGRHPNQIARDIKLWNFYKNKKELVNVFVENRVPLYILSGIFEVLEQYEDRIRNYDYVATVITKIINSGNMNAKSFVNTFVGEITDFIINSTKSKLNSEYSKIESLNSEETKIISDTLYTLKSKRKYSKNEKIKSKISSSSKLAMQEGRVDNALNSIDNHLKEVIKNIRLIEKFKPDELICSDRLNLTIKKINQINTILLRLL